MHKDNRVAYYNLRFITRSMWIEAGLLELYPNTSFTQRSICGCGLSIFENTTNSKMSLIDGAETVSTVLNISKIRFRKLPVILITFGRK
jgi:hypothetical protein